MLLAQARQQTTKLRTVFLRWSMTSSFPASQLGCHEICQNCTLFRYLIFYFSESLILRFRFGSLCMYYVNIGLISLTRRCCKTEDIGGQANCPWRQEIRKEKGKYSKVKDKQFDNPSTNCKQLSHFQIDFQASQKGKETVKSEETFKIPSSIDFETGIRILSSHG